MPRPKRNISQQASVNNIRPRDMDPSSHSATDSDSFFLYLI